MIEQLRGRDRDALIDWGEALWTARDVVEASQRYFVGQLVDRVLDEHGWTLRKLAEDD